MLITLHNCHVIQSLKKCLVATVHVHMYYQSSESKIPCVKESDHGPVSIRFVLGPRPKPTPARIASSI